MRRATPLAKTEPPEEVYVMAPHVPVGVVLVTALLIAIHWKTVLKGVIVIAATAVIVAIGFSAITMWQSLHHIVG